MLKLSLFLLGNRNALEVVLVLYWCVVWFFVGVFFWLCFFVCFVVFFLLFFCACCGGVFCGCIYLGSASIACLPFNIYPMLLK